MERSAWNWVVVRVVVVGIVCGAMGWAAAQPIAGRAAAGVDVDAERRFLIDQLTADKAITLATARRIADAKQEELHRKLQARDRALRAAEVRASGNAAELARIRKARDQIAAERQALVTALADRDRTLAAEVRAYREAVTGIANSPDPRTQAALQRFADGEQREALADAEVIADADRAARDKANDIADVAERRPWAELALQAHDQGKVTLDEVIVKYEKLTQLDSGLTWGWIYLARLYDEQGRLDAARNALRSADRSLAAGDTRDRSVVLSELGDVATKAGDLAGARARYEEGLGIARKLAQANPTSAQAQGDVGVSLSKLGDVAEQAGDLAGARARYEEGLGIARKLAQANPTSAEAQRDVGVSLDSLGDVAVESGDLAGALARYEEGLRSWRKLAQVNPTSAEAQRDVSISLNKLGNVALRAGDLAGARARYEEDLVIARKLAQANPTSAEAQRDVSVSLEKLGDLAVQAGDLASARVRYEEDLAIARKLAQANPTSAEAQRDVSISLNKLGNVAVQAGDLAGARARYEEGLGIRRKLAQANPASAEAQRDVSVSLNELGDVALQAADSAGARVRYEEDLAIARKLAQANPMSAEAQRDLLLSLFKLGKTTGDRKLLREALAIARALDRGGHLAPGDHVLLDLIPKAIDAVP
jgi:tetratricopeptide (TPR) repeat protein